MYSHQVNFTHWHASDLEPEGYRPEPISYHSSIIELVKLSCKRLAAPSILQVGRLGQGIMEFTSETKGKLFTFEPETEDGKSLIDFLKVSSQKFNAIFLWDRLLYDVDNRSELMKLIEQCSSMGTSLIIHSTIRSTIPVRPSKFLLALDSGVEIVPTTTLTANAELFEVGKQLPDWRSMKTTQLRNGFREHLLVKRS